MRVIHRGLQRAEGPLLSYLVSQKWWIKEVDNGMVREDR
jgi:hypothetical protein